jgi:hypothetical protein
MTDRSYAIDPRDDKTFMAEVERLSDVLAKEHPGKKFTGSTSETWVNASPAYRNAVADLQALLFETAYRFADPCVFWNSLRGRLEDLDCFDPAFLRGELDEEIAELEARTRCLRDVRDSIHAGLAEALIRRLSPGRGGRQLPRAEGPWTLWMTPPPPHESPARLGGDAPWLHPPADIVAEEAGLGSAPFHHKS